MKPCRFACSIAAVATLFALLGRARPADGPALLPYQNPELGVEQRVEDLLGRMTLEEKLDMLSGTGFDSKPNSRLGIPALKMADGPQGVRMNLANPFGPGAGPGAAPGGRPRPVPGGAGAGARPRPGGPGGGFFSTAVRIPATAFPAGICLAATWDTDLVQQVGRSIAQEAKALGRNMMLAPTVNINREPQGGRNFESFGEDPYLTSRIAVAYIKGIQGEGVIATVKHFAANNQETQRNSINAKVDERVLQEIYFPAFRAAVEEAGVWSVMAAYNKLNGAWCAENPRLLTEELKNEWGFKGFVVSDWGATHSTVETANAGLDLEMPRGRFLDPTLLLPAVSNGQVKQAVIDDKVRRMLRAMISMGLFDRQVPADGPVDSPEQRGVARAAATEGMVLLKNAGGVLPLGPKVRSIAVIGPNANVARVGGGGSAAVRPPYALSPLEGIRERAGNDVRIEYALGCAMEGEAKEKETAEARAALIKEAATLAANSEVALVFAGDSARFESEGFDRRTLALPAGQDELIEAVAKANENTVVVLNVGAPVAISRWIDQVPAALNAWYAGEETGRAIAQVLFSDANPSGRLPVTFPKRWEDSPAFAHYPGENGVVAYEEGLYVGYRHFDKNNIEPLFPFGHGLSYTTFDYSDLAVTPRKVAGGQSVQVTVKVRNSGSRAGAEVVQLYVRDVQSSVDRPVKELKGFRRVVLKPGETQSISFALDRGAMAYYDAAKKGWVTEPGTFEVLVGASSRDIRLKRTFELAE